jgi:trimethylamine---corrinoid protein Co-methyltransferase
MSNHQKEPLTNLSRRHGKAGRQAKMQQPLHRLPVYEILNEEGIELIHATSLQLLADVGVDFYDQEALAILKKHGAAVQGENVTFEPGLVEEYVAKAPSRFMQLARNTANNLEIGGESLTFAPVYGPPFVLDLEGGRREARLEDFKNFVKLAYMNPYIHNSGGTVVEPSDIPVETRHLDMLYSHIKYSDKAFMGSVTSAENAADSVALVEILFGKDEIRENPALISLININSPRQFDSGMLQALTIYARARQAVIITPFILSGAVAPVTIAGTLVQQNAEALAGLVYAQMVEPGTPVVYGSFMTNIDLQSGAPVFGSPESQLAITASAQLARKYGLPFRSGGMFSSAKLPDAQSAYESVMTMLPAIYSRTNFILHAAGWLENGLIAGYEKFVLDCEILGMLHKFLKGIDLSEDSLALESLRQVEPGGHHLGTDHTMTHFREAFYRAELFDYATNDDWKLAGALDSQQRASRKVKELLGEYQAPELDPGIDEALQAFMKGKKFSLA